MKVNFEIVILNPDILISKVELSDDNEHLYLHTRNFEDCGRVWSQLAGQALYATEGRKQILYNMPEDTPTSLVFDIESDPDQLILLLNYLESDFLKGAFLPKGIAQRVKQHIECNDQTNTKRVFFADNSKPIIQQEAEPLSNDTSTEKKSTKSP